ncbi:MAG: discoidin domain-containing protein, partial [Acidimicrobiales bacterium]
AVPGGGGGPAVPGGGARRPDLGGSRTGVLPPPTSPRPAPSGSGPGAGGQARRGSRIRGPGVVVLCLLLAAAVVAGVLLFELHAAGHRPGALSSPAATASHIGISNVSVFMVVANLPLDDPGGTKYAFDGNPNTFWETDPYTNSKFGNLYPGIGLAIDLGASHTVHQLVVTSPTQGWSAQTYVSATDVPNGRPVTAWGSPTATRRRISGSATFDLAGRRGRWVLLWLTNLGPAYQAKVAELSVS